MLRNTLLNLGAMAASGLTQQPPQLQPQRQHPELEEKPRGRQSAVTDNTTGIVKTKAVKKRTLVAKAKAEKGYSVGDDDLDPLPDLDDDERERMKQSMRAAAEREASWSTGGENDIRSYFPVRRPEMMAMAVGTETPNVVDLTAGASRTTGLHQFFRQSRQHPY